MKKFFLTPIILFAILTSSIAQQAENTAVTKKSDPLKEYMRPSLTTIYIDRGEPLSERIIKGAIEKGIPGKFNDNSIEQNVLSVGSDRRFTAEEMRVLLEAEISREVMRCWFPVFDEEKGEFSTHVIAERGMYNATDAEVIAANASNLKEELLKTKGLDLIGRSYILVYDIYHTSKIYNSEEEGYQTDCDVYLYHLDWNEPTMNSFYEQFSNPNGIDEVNFPVN
ncbi:MAG: hypothetical protein LBL57_04210, partial [Tannerella sp.]|nr:hypothetical protein [Tannerella sp.]